MKQANVIIINVVILILVLSTFSCKKSWLDIKANKNQVVPESLQDLQALIDNGSSGMNYWAPGLGEVSSDGHYTTEDAWATADEVTMNAYAWNHNNSYSDVDDWNQSYNYIEICNLVLEDLNKIKPGNSNDVQLWSNIKGEALFFRAYRYFDLAQLWTPRLDSSSYNTDLGLPLRLSSDITLRSVRSTVKATFDQILSDLKEAISILPDSKQYLRPNKTAGYAELARIYLSINNYDSAWVYANKCLSNYKTLIDYNSLSTSASFIGFLNPEVIFHMGIRSSDYSRFLSTRCYVDTILYNLYDSNDLRKTIFFDPSSGSYAFKGNYNYDENDLFFGLATDEIYLIRSECYARQGNTTGAMTDLNTLLSKRWKSGTFVPLTAIDANDALAKVLTERRKELILRGRRWEDLRRLNKDNRFKITITRTIGGNTYAIQPNSYQYTYPIPDDVIQLSGMKQNSGW